MKTTKTKTRFLIKLFFVAQTLFSSQSLLAAQDLKSKNAVDFQIKKDPHFSIAVAIKPGFHINDKAPNRVYLPNGQKPQPPQTLTLTNAMFLIPTIEPDQLVTARVYICDDALTVCEEHKKTWNGQGQLIAPQTTTEKDQTESPSTETQVNNLEDFSRAQALCKKNKKPILLYISARWCPSCMRMDKEFWSVKKFSSTFSLFNKVESDADRFENKPLYDKYSIRAIPTTLVLDCAGDELERFVDFQDPLMFQNQLQQIAKSKNFASRPPKVPLTKKDFGYWSEQLSALTTSYRSDPSSKHKNQLMQYYNEALSLFPNNRSSLDWRIQLAELLGPETPEGIKALNELLAWTNTLLKDPVLWKAFVASEPAGDYAGIDKLLIYEAQAGAYGLLNNPKDENTAWQAGVDEWDKNLRLKDEVSGPFFRFLIFLKKTKQEKRVLTFFEKNLKKDPSHTELRRRYAQALYDFGQYEQARDQALVVIGQSYGRNELFAASLYAKCLHKLNRTEEARRYLLKYQARTDLTESARKELDRQLSLLKMTN